MSLRGTQTQFISESLFKFIFILEFQVKVPHDPDDVFWTHIQLLRKCKFVAIIQKKITETDYDALIEGQAILGKLNKVSSNYILFYLYM